jgi:hypothetical protein
MTNCFACLEDEIQHPALQLQFEPGIVVGKTHQRRVRAEARRRLEANRSERACATV